MLQPQDSPEWTGAHLGSAWRKGAMGSSLVSAQAVAASHVYSCWAKVVWPIISPMLSAIRWLVHASMSLAQLLVCQVASSLADMLWYRSTRPVLLAAWRVVDATIGRIVYPVVLHIGTSVTAGAQWIWLSVLLPSMQFWGRSVASLYHSVHTAMQLLPVFVQVPLVVVLIPLITYYASSYMLLPAVSLADRHVIEPIFDSPSWQLIWDFLSWFIPGIAQIIYYGILIPAATLFVGVVCCLGGLLAAMAVMLAASAEPEILVVRRDPWRRSYYF